MAKDVSGAKNYNASYLYKLYTYDKVMMDAMMTGERINKDEENFDDVKIATKRRQTTAVLLNVLESPNIILLKPNKPLPLAFSVFCAKDVKVDGKLRVFIDCTKTIVNKDGFWQAQNIDAFVAQLVSAMTHLIYYADPNKITTNAKLTIHGTENFVALFSYVLDYLRVSGFRENKERIQYILGLYYQCGILWKDLNETTRNTAMKVAKIDKRHADIAEMFLKGDPEGIFLNIDTFIKGLSVNFHLNDLTTEIFVDKWVYLFGSGFQFAVEVFPAFARMITDTYAGKFLTRQKTIEKVCGNGIIELTTDIFEIGKSIAGR